VYRTDETRLTLGLEATDLIKNEAKMVRATARRGLSLEPNGGAVETDGVALLPGEVSESTTEAAGVVETSRSGISVSHRAARVDDEAEPQVGVGFELLDIIAIGSAPGAPVEAASVVAGHIFPVLRKFDRRTPDGAAVTP
jgi:hypothetical protein